MGAGAIGGHLAARFWKGGAQVTAVARGAQLDALLRGPLRVVTPDEEIIATIPATDNPAQLGPQDAVIVAVKAPALPAVAAAIGPLLGPDTAVLFAMNGIPWWYYHAHGGPLDGRDLPLLDPGSTLRRLIGFPRALGGVVYSACTVTEPGVIRVEHNRNRLVIGEPDGSLSPRLEQIAAPLRSGGLTVDMSERIRDVIWSKLLLNLGSGMLGVLTASAPDRFYIEAACQDATRAIVAEGVAIATALGCAVSGDAEGQIRNGSKSGHRTSILQDLELGRPMEIDALYTVPLQMARAAGVATPILDLLAAMTRARARSAGLYAA